MMTKIHIYVIIILVACLACKSNSKLIGVYKNEDLISLELKKDKTFTLINPRSPFDIEQKAIVIKGTYQDNGTKILLNSELTNAKPYTIEEIGVGPNGFELMISGKDWGRLDGVPFTIKENGMVVQESLTNYMGIAKFNYTKTGTLTVDLEDWEKLELSLDKIQDIAIKITLEQKDYKNKLNGYQFDINDGSLLELETFKNWTLEREPKE